MSISKSEDSSPYTYLSEETYEHGGMSSEYPSNLTHGSDGALDTLDKRIAANNYIRQTAVQRCELPSVRSISANPTSLYTITEPSSSGDQAKGDQAKGDQESELLMDASFFNIMSMPEDRILSPEPQHPKTIIIHEHGSPVPGCSALETPVSGGSEKSRPSLLIPPLGCKSPPISIRDAASSNSPKVKSSPDSPHFSTHRRTSAPSINDNDGRRIVVEDSPSTVPTNLRKSHSVVIPKREISWYRRGPRSMDESPDITSERKARRFKEFAMHMPLQIKDGVAGAGAAVLRKLRRRDAEHYASLENNRRDVAWCLAELSPHVRQYGHARHSLDTLTLLHGHR